jgi:hypothetical protein
LKTDGKNGRCQELKRNLFPAKIHSFFENKSEQLS